MELEFGESEEPVIIGFPFTSSVPANAHTKPVNRRKKIVDNLAAMRRNRERSKAKRSWRSKIPNNAFRHHIIPSVPKFKDLPATFEHILFYCR